MAGVMLIPVVCSANATHSQPVQLFDPIEGDRICAVVDKKKKNCCSPHDFFH